MGRYYSENWTKRSEAREILHLTQVIANRLIWYTTYYYLFWTFHRVHFISKHHCFDLSWQQILRELGLTSFDRHYSLTMSIDSNSFCSSESEGSHSPLSLGSSGSKGNGPSSSLKIAFSFLTRPDLMVGAFLFGADAILTCSGVKFAFSGSGNSSVGPFSPGQCNAQI